MKKFFNAISGSGATGLLFQGTFVPLTSGIPGSSSGSSLGPTLSGLFTQTGPGSLAAFFNAAFTMALAAGAILAVLRLAYAGWLYMGAADMWGSKQRAKEVIFDAILGLLLLIGIYIILNQINPNLLNLNVLQSFQSSGSGGVPCGANGCVQN
jgi:hypothetical protein